MLRSIVGVPILRDGQPIGAITVGRQQTGSFPERQIKLSYAIKQKADAQPGDVLEHKVDSVDFGRIGAQKAKQVIGERDAKEVARRMQRGEFDLAINALREAVARFERRFRKDVGDVIGKTDRELLPKTAAAKSASIDQQVVERLAALDALAELGGLGLELGIAEPGHGV